MTVLPTTEFFLAVGGGLLQAGGLVWLAVMAIQRVFRLLRPR
jgi:hypothetical protein